MVLDGNTQTEIGLAVIIDEVLQQVIGEGKIVGGGVVLVRVKIPENVGDIHVQIGAERTAHIVEAGVGDIGFLQVGEEGNVCADYRGRTHSVHRLDDTQFGVKIYGKGFNFHNRPSNA